MTKILYIALLCFIGSYGSDFNRNIKLPFSLGSAYHLCRRPANSKSPQNVWICSSPTPKPTSSTPPSTSASPTTSTVLNNNVSATNERWSVTESTLKTKARVGELIFSDEFESFNLETWSHEITMTGSGGRDWEFQMYTNNRSNSFVKDGVLHIKPTLTTDKYGESFLMSGHLDLNGGAEADQCTNHKSAGCDRTGNDDHYLPPVISARIRTMKSFAFKYGRVVVRAKLPMGDWLWPAVWLLPLHDQYGSWPVSGEIDLMESRGNKNLFDPSNINIGVEQVSSTVLLAPYVNANPLNDTHFVKNLEVGNDFSQDFHLYEMEWTPDFIKFKVDNEQIGMLQPPEEGFGELYGLNESTNIDNPWRYADNKKMAPFDQKFYITLNLAVGGISGYFPDEATGTEKPWLISSSQAYKDFWQGRNKWLPTWQGEQSSFKIDYVRVFAV